MNTQKKETPVDQYKQIPPESIPGKFRNYIIEKAKIRQTNCLKEIYKICEDTNVPISILDKMWDGRDIPCPVDNLKFLARLTLGATASRQEIAAADRQIKKYRNTRRAYFKKQQKLKKLGEHPEEQNLETASADPSKL